MFYEMGRGLARYRRWIRDGGAWTKLAGIGGPLLAVLLAIGGLAGSGGSEEVVSSEPSTSRSSQPITNASSTDSVTYQIVNREDVSIGATIRIVYRIEVSEPFSEVALRRIAQEVVDLETASQEVNAIGLFFYLPGTDTNGAYTAGAADWAPHGKWRLAADVDAGDYSSHRLGDVHVLIPIEAEPLSNRMDCDAIRGTQYLSPEERGWYLSHCVAGQGQGVGAVAGESFTLSFQATPTTASTIAVSGMTNLPDGAVIRISAQRAQRQYGETVTRATTLQPYSGPFEVVVTEGHFTASLMLDEQWLLALRNEFPIELLSNAVTVCAVFETGKDQDGISRQPDPNVVLAVGQYGEKLANIPSVTVSGSSTATPSNWLEVAQEVPLESPLLDEIRSLQNRPMGSEPLAGFCGA